MEELPEETVLDSRDLIIDIPPSIERMMEEKEIIFECKENNEWKY